MAELKLVTRAPSPRRWWAAAGVAALLAVAASLLIGGPAGWAGGIVLGLVAGVLGWSALAANAEARAHERFRREVTRRGDRPRVTVRRLDGPDVELGLGGGRIARATVDEAASAALRGARQLELVGEVRAGRHVGLVLDHRRLAVIAVTAVLERR